MYFREERPGRAAQSRLPVNVSRKVGVQSPVMAATGSSSPPCPMKKSSSIQNISKQSLSVLRRAQSSQNVSNGGRDPRSSMRNRASTPSTALAYNAELLAIFEKEKKGLEARISELVQITESRKAEIEKHKVCFTISITNLTTGLGCLGVIVSDEPVNLSNTSHCMMTITYHNLFSCFLQTVLKIVLPLLYLTEGFPEESLVFSKRLTL